MNNLQNTWDRGEIYTPNKPAIQNKMYDTYWIAFIRVAPFCELPNILLNFIIIFNCWSGILIFNLYCYKVIMKYYLHRFYYNLTAIITSTPSYVLRYEFSLVLVSHSGHPTMGLLKPQSLWNGWIALVTRQMSLQFTTLQLVSQRSTTAPCTVGIATLPLHWLQSPYTSEGIGIRCIKTHTKISFNSRFHLNSQKVENICSFA